MPHPFTWAPGEGERHASTDPAPGLAYPEGQEIQTLCGRTVVAATGVYAWLWLTCPACDARARELVGAPPRTHRQARR